LNDDARRADDLNAACIMKSTLVEFPIVLDALSPIELFVRAASLTGLPRSMGEIFSWLFCAHGGGVYNNIACQSSWLLSTASLVQRIQRCA
jgi:hypothetical protein